MSKLRFGAACVVTFTTAIALSAAPIDPKIEEIGRWPYGAAGTVTWDGDELYFGTGSVLQIWRFTPPGGLDLYSEIQIADTAREIAVVGDLLFIAVGNSGFQIVDIEDPAQPSVVSSTRTYGFCTAIAVIGETAWVSAWRSGVQGFDVSDPTRPTRVSAVVPAAETTSVTFDGSILWATSIDGLHAIDVSDPLGPVVLSTTGPGFMYSLEVIGDLGYAAAGWGGLTIFDLSDPREPIAINGIQQWEHATVDVAADGYNAYLSCWEYISVVDLSDLTHLRLIGELFGVGHGAGRSLALQGDWLAVADKGRGLRMVDVSDPSKIRVTATATVPGSIHAVGVHGDMAFTGQYGSPNGGFRTIDISDSEHPTLLGGPVGPDGARFVDFAVIGDHVYAADFQEGILIFDLSDPTNPLYRGTYEMPTNGARAVAAWDGLLLVAASLDGLVVLDVTIPDSPRMLDQFDPSDQIEGVAATNGIAYLAGIHGGLILIDLTYPTDLREISRLDTFRASSVAVEDATAYVSAAQDGLVIVDVSNPFSLVEVGRFTGTWVDTPVVKGNRVALRGGHRFECGNPLMILDVSDPTMPVRRCTYCSNIPWPAFAGDRLLVGDIFAGLSIHDLDGCFDWAGGPFSPMSVD